jgi:ParB-like nuclease domain
MAAITTLYLVHATSNEKVEQVMAEMRKLGSPRVRVVDCGDHYMAIEGCHRLTAAARLGVRPDLVVLAPGDLVEVASLDTDYFDPAKRLSAGEIVREYRRGYNPVLIINYDGTLSEPVARNETEEA